MSLNQFMMSDSDLEMRTKSIGGSDANTLMGGNPEWILNLWKEKRGEPVKRDPPTLNMLIGTATEALNVAWYASQTGDNVTDTQRVFMSEDRGYPAHATVDGICRAGAAIFEAKHTSGYDFQLKARKTVAEMIADYYPQLQHNMMVAGVSEAVISVFFDNNRWEHEVIQADPFYQEALAEAEKSFWDCVVSGNPPAGIEIINAGAVEKVNATREIDFTGNNEWADAAARYIATKQAASDHDSALSSIKALIEKDVSKAFGHGIIAKRDKRGAIRISLD